MVLIEAIVPQRQKKLFITAGEDMDMNSIRRNILGALGIEHDQEMRYALFSVEDKRVVRGGESLREAGFTDGARVVLIREDNERIL